MPDMFVQDILDPEELEKRAAWNRRMELPVMVYLDDYFQKNQTSQHILSSDYVGKVNPESYRLCDSEIAAPVRFLGLKGTEDLSKIIDNLPQSQGFYPVVSLLIDGTGCRNDAFDNVLPKEQFVLNRKMYEDKKLLNSHIKILAEIPMSIKGIGKKDSNQDFGFSAANPFYIFVCAYDDEELRQYMEEAVEVTKEFADGFIKIIGFLAPKVG